MNKNLDSLTLGEKLSQADQFARELTDLLEHGLIPKSHVLRRIAQEGLESMDGRDVTDMTIRTSVEAVLETGEFIDTTADQLILYLNSIEADILRVCRGG